jgi:hypothetical protein
MSIRDRGNKKWTAMMLTEHGEALERFAEKTKEVEMPEVDEQKLEEMNRVLSHSLVQKRPIQVTYFQNGRFQRIRGRVVGYHPLHRELLLMDEAGNEMTLLLKNIVEIY